MENKTDDNALSNYAMRNDTTIKKPVTLEKSGFATDNAMRNSYAMSKLVNCVHCGEQFERRTTWHKYCSELCKIKAYEARTGKQWKSKRTALAE